jgi:hypothetical protein
MECGFPEAARKNGICTGKRRRKRIHLRVGALSVPSSEVEGNEDNLSALRQVISEKTHCAYGLKAS